MSDSRFFQADGPFSLGQIAAMVGAELLHPEREDDVIRGVAELADAAEGDLAVFFDPRHAAAFASCHASVVVTSKKLSHYPHNGSALLLADDPRLTFAHIGRLFYPRVAPKASIHSRAFVSQTALVGEGTEI